jgi:hypothetical protein
LEGKENKRMDVPSKIKGARDLLSASVEGVKNGSKTSLRNASGKVWLYVIRATEAFFIKNGLPEDKLSKNHRGIRYYLNKYGGREFVKACQFFYGYYHIDGYYNGELTVAEFKRFIPDVEDFISKIGTG